MEDALETVMVQCELWTDNNDMEGHVVEDMNSNTSTTKNTDGGYKYGKVELPDMMVAEQHTYGNKHPNE